jgi:hypothetical protein
MTSPNVDAARRLERLLRLQFLWSGVLLTGWLMLILGGIAVSMTASLTPDQLAGRLSSNPKLFLTIMPWITAPPSLRILGGALLILGLGLVSFAIVWNRKIKSRIAA